MGLYFKEINPLFAQSWRRATWPQAVATMWTLRWTCEIKAAAKGVKDELLEISRPVVELHVPLVAIRSQIRRGRRGIQRAAMLDRS